MVTKFTLVFEFTLLKQCLSALQAMIKIHKTAAKILAQPTHSASGAGTVQFTAQHFLTKTRRLLFPSLRTSIHSISREKHRHQK